MIKKKILSFTLATILSLSTVCFIKPALMTSAVENSITQESLNDANEIVENMGVGFNLGKVFSQTIKSNITTVKSTIDSIKEAGFETVRIPVTWTEHIDTSTGNITDKEFLNELKEVVKYAIDKDLYVIINTQEDVGFFKDSLWDLSDINSSDFQQQFLNLWTDISNAFPYEEFDYHLIFEGYNEPKNFKGDVSAYEEYLSKDRNALAYDSYYFGGRCGNIANIEKLNTLFATIMQRVAPERYYMITSYNGDVISATREYSQYYYYTNSKGNNVCVNSDLYALGRWYGINYLHMPTVNKDKAIMTVHIYGLNTYKSQIDALKNSKIDIPIYIGETGLYTKDIDKNGDYLKSLIAYAKENNIGCALWDDSQSMSFINRESQKWYDNNLISEIIKSGSSKN